MIGKVPAKKEKQDKTAFSTKKGGHRREREERQDNTTPGMHTQQPTVNKEEIKQGTTGHNLGHFSSLLFAGTVAFSVKGQAATLFKLHNSAPCALLPVAAAPNIGQLANTLTSIHYSLTGGPAIAHNSTAPLSTVKHAPFKAPNEYNRYCLKEAVQEIFGAQAYSTPF